MTLNGIDIDSLARRFAQYVQRGDTCLEWVGAKTSGGYGSIGTGKERGSIQATWAALLLAGRGLPSRGQVVMHTCDNPPCVTPDHLVVGTQRENLADMARKGRSPDAMARAKRGEAHPNARLTEAKVREIRDRYAAGETQWTLARAFDISRSSIQFIVTGKSWRAAA